MTTGVVGTLSGSAFLSYAPLVDAKVTICGCAIGSGGITANGVNILYFGTTGAGSVTIFVGAGQTIVITTSGAATAIISTLESV